MNVTLPETQPFGHVFLGLDSAGVIQRVLGPCESLLGAPASAIQQTAWEDFIKQHADQSAQTGLHYVWLAVTQHAVAPDHWPDALPFKSGISASLRPVEQDSSVSFAVHLAANMEHKLNMLLSENTLETARRLTALSQNVFRGAEGPLTDPQVKDISSMLNKAEYIHQIIEAAHAEIMRSLVAAPLPHALNKLFTFSESDFNDRRLITHRLQIHSDLPDALVYCQHDLCGLVQRIVHQLLLSITVESAITLTSHPGDNDYTIGVGVLFHSTEAEFRVVHKILPLELSDPTRFDHARLIERLVTTAQAYCRPVKGQAWAEPVSESGATARIVLMLPRWMGAV